MDNSKKSQTTSGTLSKEELEKKFEKSRKYSIYEGSASSVASGAGESYISPYALALNANNAQIGFLSSIPGLLGPLSQIFGSKLMEKYDRRKLVIIFVALQAISWLLFVLAGLFFLFKFAPKAIIPFLITVYTLNVILGNFASPPWFSLMGDIVPESIRGRYFSKRNRISGAVSMVVTISAALWLDYTNNVDIAIYGFMAIFFVSFVGRIISAFLFTKHYVPPLQFEKGYYFSFFQFIKKAPFNNFGKFAIFIALINFAVSFAGPFFTVYMLKDLHFNYMTFTLVNISATFFNILTMPLWGKFADKYGNRELMRLGCIFVPIIPVLWLMSPNPLYLIFVPQLISGIGWAAFNLGASNFIYDAVTVQRRGIVIAYYSLLNGFAVFLGASIGGIMAQIINLSFINTFLAIFLISGILRAIIILGLFPLIKEVRPQVHKRKINPLLYFREFHIIGNSLHPLYGMIKTVTHPLSEIKMLSYKERKTKKGL